MVITEWCLITHRSSCTPRPVVIDGCAGMVLHVFIRERKHTQSTMSGTTACSISCMRQADLKQLLLARLDESRDLSLDQTSSGSFPIYRGCCTVPKHDAEDSVETFLPTVEHCLQVALNTMAGRDRTSCSSCVQHHRI